VLRDERASFTAERAKLRSSESRAVSLLSLLLFIAATSHGWVTHGRLFLGALQPIITLYLPPLLDAHHILTLAAV
jgi:hypothetical protein